MNKTADKPKQEVWYQKKIRELEEENAKLREVASGFQETSAGALALAAKAPITLVSKEITGCGSADLLFSLPKVAQALVLNEWQRTDYQQPWMGMQTIPNARVEGADRWSVSRDDQYITLTSEKGYYARDAANIDKREATDKLAGIIRFLRKADERRIEDPKELAQVEDERMERARLEEKIEGCDASIDAYHQTLYRFALDLSWGEEVS